MAEYGRDLVLQLVDNPEYLRASDVTVPPQYNVANESPRPMFLQVDFGLVRNAKGELEPKLVELQAFPSLYGYQPVLAQQYIESYGLSADLGIYLGGYDHDTYQQLMRELIVGGHDPENVILLEIDPQKQKTLCDFLITQRELGIAIVDILRLKKRGERLFYEKDGREIPVRRIYNRCIMDELERKDIELPFDLTDAARRGVGGTSELVLPHQQVLHPLPETRVRAEDVAARPEQHRSPRQRELSS